MDNPNKNWTIYILECENNKYYVGKSKFPDFRLEQHFNKEGSAWTTKYKPIKVVKLMPNCDSFDEDKYTRILMSQFGIENVRGGSYCQIELPEEIKNHLKREIEGAKDQCFHCKKSGHFIRDCPEYKKKLESKGKEEKEIKKEKEVKEEAKDNWWSWIDGIIKSLPTSSTSSIITKEKCTRCGFYGHIKANCYSKKHSDGTPFQVKKCSRCHWPGHSAKKCFAKTDANGKPL